MAESLGLGFLVTGLIVAALIAVTAVGWRLGLNSVLSFWIIYILTRPLGASIGDYLSQPASDGGLGLGATVTSMIFFGAIIGLVIYLSVTKADVITGSDDRCRSSPPNAAGCGRRSWSSGCCWPSASSGYLWQTSALAGRRCHGHATAAAGAAAGGWRAPQSPRRASVTYRRSAPSRRTRWAW